MTRRTFLGMAACCSLGSFLAACGAIGASPAASPKLPLVGYLTAQTEGGAGQLGPFREGLRDLGYIEGQNIRVEVRRPNQSAGSLDELVTGLLALKPDVIAADGVTNATAVKRLSSSMPIVLLGASDPVALGLAESVAHPGGTITGLSLNLGPSGSKEIELLKDMMPAISRLGVLALAGSADVQPPAMEMTARDLRIGAQRLEFQSAADFERAFQTAAGSRLEALAISETSTTGPAGSQLRELAVKYRLPTVGALRKGSTILSYGASTDDLRRRGAGYVDRILRGAKPSDLPIEMPTKYDLVINVELAGELGVTIPQSLLAQATEVIQ